MLLNMYKVGFGDCFKLEENSSKTTVKNNSGDEYEISLVHRLLVDCGSKSADLPAWGEFDDFVNFIYNDFFCSINDKHLKKYALLTHFHEDHYKGFLRLSEKFESKMKGKKAFVPNDEIILEILKAVENDYSCYLETKAKKCD